MFRLLIHFDKDNGNFGFVSSKEYFFKCTDVVVEVIKSLSGLKCFYSLAEFLFSSLYDVKSDFKLIYENSVCGEEEKKNKDELP